VCNAWNNNKKWRSGSIRLAVRVGDRGETGSDGLIPSISLPCGNSVLIMCRQKRGCLQEQTPKGRFSQEVCLQAPVSGFFSWMQMRLPVAFVAVGDLVRQTRVSGNTRAV
jgi:hypothetical protein